MIMSLQSRSTLSIGMRPLGKSKEKSRELMLKWIISYHCGGLMYTKYFYIFLLIQSFNENRGLPQTISGAKDSKLWSNGLIG